MPRVFWLVEFVRLEFLIGGKSLVDICRLPGSCRRFAKTKSRKIAVDDDVNVSLLLFYHRPESFYAQHFFFLFFRTIRKRAGTKCFSLVRSAPISDRGGYAHSDPNPRAPIQTCLITYTYARNRDFTGYFIHGNRLLVYRQVYPFRVHAAMVVPLICTREKNNTLYPPLISYTRNVFLGFASCLRPFPLSFRVPLSCSGRARAAKEVAQCLARVVASSKVLQMILPYAVHTIDVGGGDKQGGARDGDGIETWKAFLRGLRSVAAGRPASSCPLVWKVRQACLGLGSEVSAEAVIRAAAFLLDGLEPLEETEVRGAVVRW